MNFHHDSVLLQETIMGLNIKPDGIYVDCTLGGAGHSSEILKRLTTGFYMALIEDITAIEASYKRLSEISNRFEIIKSNFIHLKAN